MNTTVKKKYKIVGMHCTSCAMNIDFELEDVAGVVSCKTSYARQELEIEMDEGMVKLEEVKKTVAKLGYTIL